MSMSADLTRRLQVLLDAQRYERLERLARQRGASVATIVREAIDAAFPDDVADRAAAAERILAAEPIPVDDWNHIKDELESFYQPPLR
jgi:predicted DNA-binding protein